MLDVAEGIAGGAAGRAAPVTAIIGTAGDRPDDTLRGIARIAASRAQRVAIKETLKYLRGRSREGVVGEMLAGVKAAGRSPSEVTIYESETAALRGELANGDGRPRVIVLMCHEERDEVFELLGKLGREADRRLERAHDARAAPPGAAAPRLSRLGRGASQATFSGRAVRRRAHRANSMLLPHRWAA